MAGAKRIIAIDPVEFKREKAMEFGATHTYASMAEAIPHLMELSWGEMADRVIMTPGVLHGDMMGEAMSMVGKGGTCVVTAISPMTETSADINLFQLAMWNKEVKGTIFGSLNPRADIPKLLDMYRTGDLMLDELITKRYTLDDINEGYRAMREGENIRGVIVND
jgi:S-(hydroxymethyl)glutathione dehydrogenase/alcohol dehydrogenase